MRTVLSLLLLAAIAAVAALTLGTNDGLVAVYWRGWRVDLSLNLFLILLLGAGAVAYLLVRTTSGLVGLPERARQWREQQRERVAQQALREAQGLLFAGRYGRAHRAAQRAIEIHAATPGFRDDGEFAALAHLVAASCLHRLQDRTRRDEQLQKVEMLLLRQVRSSALSEGASLLAAEWALEDRDAPRALERLAELPSGVARRTHAMRLRLQAARLAQEPLEALRTARLLAKHQGFAPIAAQGLMRALAIESLDTARDAEQLRRVWNLLEAPDRRDPMVSAHAARLAVRFDARGDARAWLKPHWGDLAALGEAERHAVLQSFVQACPGLPVDWLPLLESALVSLPADARVAYAVGVAMAERQLWGRAARLMQSVVESTESNRVVRGDAWLILAQIAEREGDAARAQHCYHEIGRLALHPRP